MRLEFLGQQALSRLYDQTSVTPVIQSAPENPLKFRVHYELVKQPFTMAICGLVGANPSIGAVEYFDNENDQYLSQRWPAHLAVEGWMEIPDNWVQDDRALTLARSLLWHKGLEPLFISTDQRSDVLGYRRDFLHIPSLDAFGIRRPVPTNGFASTTIGEPSGPGFVAFKNFLIPGINTEFVWSEILKFPNRKNFDEDKDAIIATCHAKIKHFNSHSELRDSKRHIKNSDHKGAIRSAASAIEACLLHCAEVNFARMPSDRGLRFDEKIAKVLELAHLPPFTQLEPEHTRNILYTYRARSKMHEGDCYYFDLDNNRRNIRHVDQARPFVEAAEAFVFWMDTVL